MRSLILYCSDYKGNTEMIAGKIAKKIKAELLNIKDMDNKAPDTLEYSLIGFGSGVYRETLSHRLYSLVEDLDLEGKDVFVFSTSGVGMKYYNNSLIKLLRKKGANVKGSFACKGSFVASEFTDKKIFDALGKLSRGHPDVKDINRAEEFIVEVVDSI
ncbi:flavodoxin family protein [Gudongella sp. SC589]|uniref:flavodoxin family protein n=1 Tax=Gudongella sp. SC589 TaxID=3385990 RepID=UPI003904864F